MACCRWLQNNTHVCQTSQVPFAASVRTDHRSSAAEDKQALSIPMSALQRRLPHIQHRTYELLEPAKGNDTASHATDMVLSAAIVIAVLSDVLETLPQLARYSHHFSSAETFFIILFSLEYLLRLWAAPCASAVDSPARSRLKYVLSFNGLVDLLAILPFYISFMIPGANLTLLRLLRVIRILKLSHYNSALFDLWSAIYDERKAFLSASYLFSIALVITSSAMYYVENDVQPDKFSSIPAAMWWSVITLTTVGYGDVSPITAVGKLLGAVTALLGVCTLALLTGIVANSFSAQLARKRAIFEAAIHRALEDGVISSHEKDYLKRMRDEFNITHEHAEAIFAKALQEQQRRNH